MVLYTPQFEGVYNNDTGCVMGVKKEYFRLIMTLCCVLKVELTLIKVLLK